MVLNRGRYQIPTSSSKLKNERFLPTQPITGYTRWLSCLDVYLRREDTHKILRVVGSSKTGQNLSVWGFSLYKRVKFSTLMRLIEGWGVKCRNGTPAYKNRGRAPPEDLIVVHSHILHITKSRNTPLRPLDVPLRGPAYLETVSTTNHKNQWNNDVILDCNLSKPYMVLKGYNRGKWHFFY